MSTTDLPRGVRVSLIAKCRDIGYGVEEIAGEYIFAGEIDTWGKPTLYSTDGEPTIYLFTDEIVAWEPLS
jgi:hypothetical protein